MTTKFSFEHVFQAPSTATILAAYFDADHLATQDRVAELGDRVIVEQSEDDAERRCTWRVTSLKPLPLIARPFVTGGKLTYLEAMVWRRADDVAELVVTPQILSGRVQLAATYTLTKVGDGQIKRHYHGSVTVNIRLLSSKIENGILAELERSMPAMAACTQGWLDRQATA